MRLLLLGTAAIALSGCSWFGGSKYQHQPAAKSAYGVYAKNGDCCAPLSRWNVEGAIGQEFLVGGDIFTGDKIHVVPGNAAANQKMEDVFDNGMRYELGGSYALNPNRKLTLMGSYANAEGNDVTVGVYGGNALTGRVSDYERFGVEAGLRQYFNPTPAPLFRSVRPYVEAKVGATNVKDITLQNAQLGGAVENGGTIGLYEGGWVPSAAGMVGIEAPVFKRATLALESGIRYTGQIENDTTYFNGAHPLSGVNRDSKSFTVPVMLRGRYRF